MQGPNVISCKDQDNIWTVFWDSCLQWLTLIIHLFIQTIESIPALRQLLEISGLRSLYLPVSHAWQSSSRSTLLPPQDKKDAKKLTVSCGNIKVRSEKNMFC